MTCVYSGVQNRILDLNPSPIFTPCKNQPFSLVAAHVNVQPLTLLVLWNVFGYCLCAVKSHSGTRWSSKAAAVNAIAAVDASLLVSVTEKSEFVALLTCDQKFSRSLVGLRNVFRLQKQLLSSNESSDNSIHLIDKSKNELCTKAEDLCSDWGVIVSRGIKKVRSMPGENASDAGLNTREGTHRSIREIPDKTEVDISDRFSQFQESVGLLFNAETVVKQLDLQNQEQFTDLTCTHLAHQHPNTSVEWKCISTTRTASFPSKEQNNWQQPDFSAKELLRYVSSVGLEAH
jgi:hypothetical protein